MTPVQYIALGVFVVAVVAAIGLWGFWKWRGRLPTLTELGIAAGVLGGIALGVFAFFFGGPKWKRPPAPPVPPMDPTDQARKVIDDEAAEHLAEVKEAASAPDAATQLAALGEQRRRASQRRRTATSGSTATTQVTTNDPADAPTIRMPRK